MNRWLDSKPVKTVLTSLSISFIQYKAQVRPRTEFALERRFDRDRAGTRARRCHGVPTATRACGQRHPRLRRRFALGLRRPALIPSYRLGSLPTRSMNGMVAWESVSRSLPCVPLAVCEH